MAGWGLAVNVHLVIQLPILTLLSFAWPCRLVYVILDRMGKAHWYRWHDIGIMMGGDGIITPIAGLPPKTTQSYKKLGKWGKWENDTSKAIYIKAYTVFPYFRQIGKWGK